MSRASDVPRLRTIALSLRAALQQILPSPVYARALGLLQLWLRPMPGLISFASAFPGVAKIAARTYEPVPTPDAPQMTFLPLAAPLQHSHYAPPDDYVALLDGALYCSLNSVVKVDRRTVLAESLGTGRRELQRTGSRAVTDLPGTYALWRSRRNGYYHTLVDNLPRLLALHVLPAGVRSELQILHPPDLSPLESFLLSTYRPAGAVLQEIDPQGLYRLGRLAFTPFKSRRYAGYLAPPYVEAIRAPLLPNRPGRRNRRILISRADANRRRITNTSALARALQPLGFEEVVLQGVPFREQVALFYDAEIVVGAHGAGLTNLLFSQACHVVELFPCPYVVPHYYYLATAMGLGYSYWCGHAPFHHDDFEADVAAVTAAVIAALGENQVRLPMPELP